VAKALQRILTKQGVEFRLGVKVLGAKGGKTEVSVSVEPVAGGAKETLQADVVLVAIGRSPYTDGLGLDAIGVKQDSRGFIETEAFRTAVDGVFAIGDVTHGPMLAHKAEDEAVACIEIIAGRAGHVDYGVIPSVVYTDPEVAVVGRTEEELKGDGVAYKVGRFAFTANARAKVNHEAQGFVKVLADAVSDQVLGVHMIGPDVGELIGEWCVAMAFSAASEDVARTCHPHPTRSEASRQAAMAVDGWAMQA
jgi:dihydrolipoamide dehydrogenase